MKILIGYDGSEGAGYALKDLAAAGMPAKAQAMIVTVIPPMLPMAASAPQSFGAQGYPGTYVEVVVRNRLKSESKLSAKAYSASRELKRSFPGWKMDVDCIIGSPAEEILNRADEYKPDMIVMGSRGWSLTGRLLIGSVAEKVLTHSRSNIRICKGKPKQTGPPRLLIGFDGSKESKLAVEVVADRNWPEGTLVQLTAVSDFRNRMDQLTRALGAGKTPAPEAKSSWPWMEDNLAKAKERLAQREILAEAAILSGDPRTVLLAQAKKFRADTLFLGSRGISGVKRFLLGSVSAYVSSRSPCSMEIIRMRGGQTS